jgi:P pilus assembly chaperone PapD
MSIVRRSATAGALLGLLGIAGQTSAAIALDRTRVIFDGANKSVSLRVTNENKALPYLAQGWLEDVQGNKITDPLVILPPVQRIEPGEQSQLKIQTLPTVQQLPQDRETLFYFNLREIPPKSSKPNTLQLALQTRIKLFYRPASIEVKRADYATPFQERVTLTRVGDRYHAVNPTPYYISLIKVASGPAAATLAGFKPVMIEPKGQLTLKVSASLLGNTPVLTYVNDFGGRVALVFNCAGNHCIAVPQEKKK